MSHSSNSYTTKDLIGKLYAHAALMGVPEVQPRARELLNEAAAVMTQAAEDLERREEEKWPSPGPSDEAVRLLSLVQEYNALGSIKFEDSAYHIICDIASFLDARDATNNEGSKT